jgi:hypothetical protein
LIDALKASHAEDRTVALKRSGILTEAGTLDERYKNWGNKVSVTEADDEAGN